ncbi:MAG: ParA family protein [Phycisphaerae bacterium]|nr:ParA family protein [Phycisphaerae bacterium]
MTETISLLNMKGGVGKTTLAVTLARYAYVRRGKRVLLIDFDPQFNSSQHLMHFRTYADHVQDKGTIADLLIESPTLRLQETGERISPSDCIARLGAKSAKSAYFDLGPATK